MRRDVVLSQELAEKAWVTRVHVLKDENAWRAHGPSGARGSPARALRIDVVLIDIAGAKGEGR
jgi:hypothetical protein